MCTYQCPEPFRRRREFVHSGRCARSNSILLRLSCNSNYKDAKVLHLDDGTAQILKSSARARKVLLIDEISYDACHINDRLKKIQENSVVKIKYLSRTSAIISSEPREATFYSFPPPPPLYNGLFNYSLALRLCRAINFAFTINDSWLYGTSVLTHLPSYCSIASQGKVRCSAFSDRSSYTRFRE